MSTNVRPRPDMEIIVFDTGSRVNIFISVTKLGKKNIKKERVGKYDISMVPLFLLLFGDAILMLILFSDAAQDCVLML